MGNKYPVLSDIVFAFQHIIRIGRKTFRRPGRDISSWIAYCRLIRRYVVSLQNIDRWLATELHLPPFQRYSMTSTRKLAWHFICVLTALLPQFSPLTAPVPADHRLPVQANRYRLKGFLNPPDKHARFPLPQAWPDYRLLTSLN